MECFLGFSSFLAAISALAGTPVRLWFLLEVGFRPRARALKAHLLGAKTRIRRAGSLVQTTLINTGVPAKSQMTSRPFPRKTCPVVVNIAGLLGDMFHGEGKVNVTALHTHTTENDESRFSRVDEA
ncbi:hypothetical protein NEUTE2DRAFT_126123 [Neurospora tetrasperma FGSC 2509]|nr:hypothetical protein NEUTE2DRAFT_126123 [Neurospora tetrasperma FGSC 2509]